MLDEIVTVVKKCGDIILFADGAERNVSSKEGRANFVTKYDVAVQAYLEEELLKILPEAVFIGEEGEHSKAIGEGYAFIVDPIDGTTNFIKNYHRSCVSVGLALHGLWKSALFITHTVMRCFMRSRKGSLFKWSTAACIF